MTDILWKDVDFASKIIGVIRRNTKVTFEVNAGATLSKIHLLVTITMLKLKGSNVEC